MSAGIPIYTTRKHGTHDETGQWTIHPWLASIVLPLIVFNAVAWLGIGAYEAVHIVVGILS